jgi:hypothetical protein
MANCLPEGMPLVEMAPVPYKIVQTPGLTLTLYDRDTTFHQVYIGLRPGFRGPLLRTNGELVSNDAGPCRDSPNDCEGNQR